jgi:hypothetical protein
LSAVDTTASVALVLPEDAGANVTVNVTLWFGESVIGKLSPLTLKAAPLTLVDEMVTVDPPVLVKVSERFELLPFCTLPKESAAGDAARVLALLEPLGANPWQPVSSATPLTIMKREVMKQRRDRKTCKGPIP